MRCVIVIELQGVLSKPLYTTFLKMVEKCRGRLRVFNQETNEFLARFVHRYSDEPCNELEGIIGMVSYCLSSVKVHIITDEAENKVFLSRVKSLSKQSAVRSGNEYRFLIKGPNYTVIGTYNLLKKVLTAYALRKEIELRELPLITLGEVSTISSFTCDLKEIRERYDILKELCLKLKA